MIWNDTVKPMFKRLLIVKKTSGQILRFDAKRWSWPRSRVFVRNCSISTLTSHTQRQLYPFLDLCLNIQIYRTCSKLYNFCIRKCKCCTFHQVLKRFLKSSADAVKPPTLKPEPSCLTVENAGRNTKTALSMRCQICHSVFLELLDQTLV